MSLGHHLGGHDGTDAEERLHSKQVGKGRILVVSAGNDRDRQVHAGGALASGETQEIAFDLLGSIQRCGTTLTIWHAPEDDFNITLLAATGDEIRFEASSARSPSDNSRA